MNEYQLVSSESTRMISRYFGEKVLDTKSWAIGFCLNAKIRQAAYNGKTSLEIYFPDEWTIHNLKDLSDWCKQQGYTLERINQECTISFQWIKICW